MLNEFFDKSKYFDNWKMGIVIKAIIRIKKYNETDNLSKIILN